MAGEVVHYEIGVTDADRAQRFWSGLFGWEFGPSAMPEGEYRMAQTGPGSGAALNGFGEPGHPNVYHGVDDIDASIATVRELGGEADEKQPVPTHGWFAACKDTEGNVFYLWQQDASAGQ
ncbi:MAG TPA: VOC family protein [Gaiellaceae bacterium]|nr:VOC family protein [Gaiellaceae bacterium]